jgi:alpha-glucosidase
MIKRYQYGTPLQTDAVPLPPLPQTENEPPHLQVQADGCTLTCPLTSKAAVYGLGETVRGINKRGWLYKSNCTDDPAHTECKHSLYAAHNFLLISGDNPFGLFLDFPGTVTFDIGYTDTDLLTICTAEPNFDLYCIEGSSLEDIVHQFRILIGRSYIAPKWAFGYGQSRWSYCTEDEVREVVRQHRENHIPLDSVYLDIDYMDHYKDFTINDSAFPNFSAFTAEMRQQNIHLVPIIDAGVKEEPGYAVYDEGIQNGYFCKKADGTPFVGAVWPGKALFPDFLNPQVRNWFGQKYRFLLEQGIDGFWNDMNEPAIFYSEDHLKQIFQELKELGGQNPDMEKLQHLQETFGSLANNPDDYASFYHNFQAKNIRHDRVHNLYGYNMTRAAGEALQQLSPDRRILLFSRSSYIGMHRYGGLWTGDNRSWWSHLLLEIQMMPSLNMCGFLYTGADIGGFGDDTTADLLLRWIAFGIFTPLMRNHAALGTRQQEVYRFAKQVPVFRRLIGIRYALLPYLYSEYMKAALQDRMYFRPLAFVYPQDPHAAEIEDQLMLGNELMIAPVYRQNANGRTVYLPEPMKLIRMRSADQYTSQQLEAGFHYISVALDEVVFFLRPNTLIPLSHGGESVPEVDFEHLRILENVQAATSYVYYHDDGSNRDYDNPSHLTTLSLTHGDTAGVHGGGEIQADIFQESPSHS